MNDGDGIRAAADALGDEEDTVPDVRVDARPVNSIEPPFSVPVGIPPVGRVALKAWQMVPRRDRGPVARWAILVLCIGASFTVGAVGMYLVAKGWRP